MEDCYDYDSDCYHGRGVGTGEEISRSSGRREDPLAGRDCVVGDAPAAPDEEEEEAEEAEEAEEGFTFAAVRGLGVGGVFSGGRIGPVYPVFGRPRSPPPQQQQQEVEDRYTATVRVPLGQLLLQERGFPSSGKQADEEEDDDEDGNELDGVPAETYCLWSPGSTSPAAAAASPARCQKSGSTGSVLRWRQRLIGRSHSDGKEKFVFLDAASPSSAAPKGSAGRAWSYYGRGGGSGRGSRSRTTTTPPSFLPYKQDLVGLFANAGAFRRSYHPF